MSSASSPLRSRDQGGFTLLEVLCAFAILAAVTGLLTRIFVQNVQQGTRALARRELREAADTIFRKIIYEHTEYNDGDSRTLDEEYGDFARLKGYNKDRWSIYTMTLEKKPQTVAGYDPGGDETLFGETSDSDETASTAESEATTEGFRLTRLTLKIFRTEDFDQEPLLTLSTWIDPGQNEGGVR